MWVYTATYLSRFDTDTPVQIVSQKESDSYFTGVGLMDGELRLSTMITFDELQHTNVEDIPYG